MNIENLRDSQPADIPVNRVIISVTSSNSREGFPLISGGERGSGAVARSELSDRAYLKM